MFFENLFFPEYLDISLYHLCHHLCDRIFSSPAESCLCLGGITEEEVNLCRTKVSRIYLYEDSSCLSIVSLLFDSTSPPLYLCTDFSKCPLDKLPDTVGLTCRKDKVLGNILLKHEPHTPDIVLRMSPVTLRIEISYIKCFLQSEVDARDRTRNLTCDKCLTTDRRFMIEEESITSEYIIALTVIYRDPVSIKFRYTIRTTWMKWRKLCISFFWHIVPDSAKHL